VTNIPEAAAAGHAVIYAIGTPGCARTQVPDLRAYVAAESWVLFDICFDQDNAAHPADRPGLRLALDRIRLGSATILVLDKGVYASMPEPEWLSAAVRAAYGAIHPFAHVELAVPHHSTRGGLHGRHGECGRDAVPPLQEAG
jgi:hypothetical protein